MSERENEEAIYIPVTGKTVGVLFAAVAALFGGDYLANWYVDDTTASYPRSAGDKLEDIVYAIKLEVDACQDRQYKHRENQASQIATLIQKQANNEYLIKQCMSRTGL